tara:strand:+ start:3885 stop:8570 length:4686 start_codon:yes stop_codon:yes gene_type:complete
VAEAPSSHRILVIVVVFEFFQRVFISISSHRGRTATGVGAMASGGPFGLDEASIRDENGHGTGDSPTRVVDDDEVAMRALSVGRLSIGQQTEDPSNISTSSSTPSSQASYLDAVSEAITTMPAETLKQSLEYVLGPVIGVLRGETNALGSMISGTDLSISNEPPVRRAERLRALEASVKCISKCVRTANSAGTTPEHSTEQLATLITLLGTLVKADGVMSNGTSNGTSENNKNTPFEPSTLETLKTVTLDAIAAVFSVYSVAENVLLFLINNETLPVVGYLISLLLDVAKVETEKGSSGNRKIRREALFLLRETVAVLSKAESIEWLKLTRGGSSSNAALDHITDKFDTVKPKKKSDYPSCVAFFLPGIVGGCARAIASGVGNKSGHGSGPAGVSDDYQATEAAIRVLADICCAVLSDRVCLDPGFVNPESPEHGIPKAHTETLAAELRRVVSGGNKNADRGVLSEHSEGTSDGTSTPPQLRVVRTKQWLSLASPKVAHAVTNAYRQLVTNSQKPSTRRAAAVSSVKILEQCGNVLGEDARVHLLSTALTVAGDSDWAEIAGEVCSELDVMARNATRVGNNTRLTAHTNTEFPETLARVFREALAELPKNVRSSGDGVACARRIDACLELIGEDLLTQMICTKHSLRRSVVNVFVACFEFQQSFGGNHAATMDGGYFERTRPERWINPRNPRNPEYPGGPDTGPNPGNLEATTVPSAVPPGSAMAYLADPELFKPVAHCVRKLGGARECATALIEVHLTQLREILKGAEDAEDDGNEGNESYEQLVFAFRRKACAHVSVITELLFGACEARLIEEAKKTSADARISHTSVASSTRTCLQEFLASSAWDLPTSGSAVEVAARKRNAARREGTKRKKKSNTRKDEVDRYDGYDDTDESDLDMGNQSTVSAQAIFTASENATLVCLLIEGVGACALACGKQFVRDGGFLPTALTPLLQKLGDDCLPVRETAGNVLGAVAQVGGFDTENVDTGDTVELASTPIFLDQTKQYLIGVLVSKNADYVVDALSRRLRRLDDFPDAPRFFKAVLGSDAKGAARDLLPYLKDPILRVTESLSISRRNIRERSVGHGETIELFLQVISETSKAIEAEATFTSMEIDNAETKLKPLLSALEQINSESMGKGSYGGLVGAEWGMDEGVDETAADELNSDGSEKPDRLTPDEILHLSEQLPPHLAQWRRRQTRVANLSRLSSAMLKAAAPLMESGDVRRRMLASEAVTEALRGLSSLAFSHAKDQNVTDALRKAFPDDVPDDDSIRADDKIVKVLPLVHETWPSVVLSICGYPKGPAVRPSAFVKSLDSVYSLAQASQPGDGSFVSKRFLVDAWPGLSRALRFGAPSVDKTKDLLKTRLERVVLIDSGMRASTIHELGLGTQSGTGLISAGAADGGTDTNSESSDTRASETVKLSVLDLLFRLAVGAKTRGALADTAPRAITQITPLALNEGTGDTRELGTGKQSRKITEKAKETLFALSKINPDAAWLELNQRATNRHNCDFLPTAPGFTIDSQSPTSTLPTLPAFRTICPVTKETEPAVASEAANLLRQIESF